VAKQYKLEKSGVMISLSAKPFAGGGEGNLYKITAPKNFKKYVAKLYHPHKLSSTREEKINYLAAYSPVELGENRGAHNSVIWVKDALYDRGKFVGFIMPYTEGEKLEILCTPKIPRKLRRDWARFDFKKSPNVLDLRLKLSFNICAAIHQVHSMERYVLVDMKPDNILIQTNGLVSVVDTDSVEVVEAGKSLFDAPVATPEYTPPEHYKNLDYDPTEREAWDRFGLGVILYKLLFGIHPFAASSGAPYEQLTTLQDKIKHGLFVHDSAKKASFSIIPPLHKAFYKLDQSLQDLFFRCFIDGGIDPELRPNAEEWCATILLSLEDERAYKRYGHILGSGLYSTKPRFALPSAQIDLPSYSVAASRLVDLSKNKDVFKRKIRIPTKSELKDFQVKPLKWGKMVVLCILVGLFTMIGTPLGGIAFLGFLVYREYKRFKKNGTYRNAQRIRRNLAETEKKYSTQLYRLRQKRKKFKHSVRSIVPEIEYFTKKIKEKVEAFKVDLKEQDDRVKALEIKALEQYHALNKKYVDKALGHRVIARVEDGNYSNLAKIRIAIHYAHKKAVDELLKERPINEHHPFMKEGKIAISSLMENKRTKISDLVGTKVRDLYNEQEAKIKLLYQEVREDTFINNHLYRLWKGKRGVSDSVKEELKEALEEFGLTSILQIDTINTRTGAVRLKDGQELSTKPFRGSKTILTNLKYWHDETKHQLNALNKKKLLLKKDYRQKISVLENEKRMELKSLDHFKRGELAKVKIETQKIVLGAPFTKLQEQYETVTDYVTELETAYEKEEALALKDYRAMYESIIKNCEIRANQAVNEVAKMEEMVQKYSKKINHPKVQKRYRELEDRLIEVKELLPKLEMKKFENDKYININFNNYLRKRVQK